MKCFRDVEQTIKIITSITIGRTSKSCLFPRFTEGHSGTRTENSTPSILLLGCTFAPMNKKDGVMNISP
uniref:Uncharacterized protein n=1 Tax=Physcomitrium patens TaxID=3218 RepID=A0A2K1KH74_PHYPA|nr:hypothetical protein PHYPA_009505 [Physcomitrium patens]